MSIVPNSQSLTPIASGNIVNSLVTRFKSGADTVLIGGRDITLHLPPALIECVAGCKFNSTYEKYFGVGGALCRTCRGDGFTKEPRQTIYRANIRHTDESLASPRGGGENTPAGRVYEALIRTKTVIESYNHILLAETAEIDGIKCTLWNDPRQTGFGDTLLYVIAFWKKVNKKVSN